jgi:CarD family transcriptional regulator
MFSLNDKVVYPGHGVARISRIIEKKVGGNTTRFFELRFLSKDMTILVPVSNATSVGIRQLSSEQNISALFEMLTQPQKVYSSEVLSANWNKRNKEYQGKIRTGNLQEICAIYRDLKRVENHKELSFGEKTLLHQTESLLAEEIALVNKVKEEKAVETLRSLVGKMKLPLSHAIQRS